MIPVSLKLKSTVPGFKAKRILFKAEKSLLQERIRQCELCFKSLQQEIDDLECYLKSKLDSRPFTFDPCKQRQRKKFDNLVIKSNVSNSTKTHSSVNTDKWVINPSDMSVSDTERDVLMKGLNFAVTPERLPVEDIVSATESVCRRLDFCHKKSTAEKLRADVTKILMKSKLPKSNVNRNERGAIKNLAKDEDIIILPADKGRSTVIKTRGITSRKCQHCWMMIRLMKNWYQIPQSLIKTGLLPC